MKTVQYFSDEYLERCRDLDPTQIARFLEEFRYLHQESGKSKLISMKVPERLLAVFRQRCDMEQVPYQTQIKRLMEDWLLVAR